MFTHHEDFWDVEDCCYETEHIAAVTKEIQGNFQGYFVKFLRSKNGGTKGERYKQLLINAEADFEKNRQKYLEIMDLGLLAEMEDDPAVFKSQSLRQDCPIIHATLYNKRAKVLDKYRANFSHADSADLLTVVKNLSHFGADYQEDTYDADSYDTYCSLEDLGMQQLDKDENYMLEGVLGGGIRSHLLYKVYPNSFPNRSRSAIWALWYLTNRKVFGCETDSEFLMIDTEENTTQQNYFYPYALFTYYAFVIYQLLKEQSNNLKLYINPEYRYVIVDAFLEFIASEHIADIELLSEKIADGGHSYA